MVCRLGCRSEKLPSAMPKQMTVYETHLFCTSVSVTHWHSTVVLSRETVPLLVERLLAAAVAFFAALTSKRVALARSISLPSSYVIRSSESELSSGASPDAGSGGI